MDNDRLISVLYVLLYKITYNYRRLDSPAFGLCANITSELLKLQEKQDGITSHSDVRKEMDKIKEITKAWDKYSGDETFPIPASVGLSTIDTYSNVPHYEDEQLELRKDWLIHIIVCLENPF